ncbi:helix-turn-helix transcriptional regulator [Deinococcus kurensis]|uniref:helix-turn-helix transcriptional regulator n=1 Tax=Deinococcus kurensis TaxID=2662757 RepID=UPI0012D3200D|nr:helix-turn-helix transcriptional regulator [Deinococcus kurensis]
MIGPAVSSPHEVTDPAAVALLAHDRTRRVLGAFLGREQTVAGAAREAGLDLRVVHRDVQALRRAGLLHVIRAQARAGRPVKVYRARADDLFVDARHLPPQAGEGQAAALDALFHHAAEREFRRALSDFAPGWGLRVYATPDAPGFAVLEGPRSARPLSPLDEWQGPPARMLSGTPTARLSAAQVAEVQRDLILLMRRVESFSAANAGTGQPVLLRLGLAPLTEGELRNLHR